jgi:glycosyltransferase involved in cell wall biosynthesis
MTEPLVSVCIPVLNGGDLVLRAVRSALEQEYSRIEVVVVDDASSDGTAERVRMAFGNRVILGSNGKRAGHGRALNATISHANGTLLKFLDHDDYLHPDSVSRLVEGLERSERAGIAFSRRRLEFDGEVGAEWLEERFSDPQASFQSIGEVNEGPSLLDQLVAAGLPNWIGEPSCVLVRRDAVLSLGGFCPYTRQSTDLDLWVRILARFDAAFVDEKLCTYRVSVDSLSGRNAAAGAAWMDRLWTIENLLSLPEVGQRYPELAERRDAERRAAWRSALRGLLGLRTKSESPEEWFQYMRCRVRRRLRGRHASVL